MRLRCNLFVLAMGLSFISLWDFSGACLATAAEPKPIKVFILAGQSNMEGHAKVSTFDYIADDPQTQSLYAEMVGPDGTPRVADNVWISYRTGRGDNNGEGFGKLTAGYGSRSDPTIDGGKIGPEFTFGLAMDEAFEEPVLIIKTAWGGKSLFYDFRSPSSGVYEQTERDIEKNRNPVERSGHYYRLMIEHVREVLSDIQRVYPGYKQEYGYEIAGFVWFQGFNDMVNRDVYPELPSQSEANRFENYSAWLANLIRDVRRDLDAPHMPFVIGVMGVDGMRTENINDGNRQFRTAMAAPASYPEFQGNVGVVQTGEFWDEPLAAIQAKVQRVAQQRYLLDKREVSEGRMTKAEMEAAVAAFEAELISPAEAALRARGASNAGYHYLGCAKTFALMGKAFATEMLAMMPPPPAE
ncbi:sialate O-acetylesterase [Allorhodopirellula heiligendammensis]|uniref:Sialate O-acetylesterase domain-containing protein n=1 Tax=Allorhodopirellula heiligendammensis TaxID=2714739 RepID=A0A5C6C2N8_9BACT|nr:sialate O-acetylesterase [Allorhodopirellula heiligendammensis]TWU18452.1 hypothetical protein Poly21_06150 [Allorhodopirellula heiligendammensis]